MERVVVNSTASVVGKKVIQQPEPGKDLILSLDARIQKLTEKALATGIYAARQSYNAPDGAAVVLDPNTGGVIATASFPTFDPEILADGYSFKDQKLLGGVPEDDNQDDGNFNRVIQSTVNPGSTFKVATAGAAMATGVMGPYDYRDCPGALQLSDIVFNNWTSADMGTMGIPKSLEVSCDTFYYELGWEMENNWGAANGDGSEKFQDYLRTAGFGHPTGIDLPNEYAGNVPDEDWCIALARADSGCFDGWLPGMSVNMSIGQGDLLATPLQMAVSYAAVLNGGNVLKPHIGGGLGVPDADTGEEETVKEFETQTAAKLPLDDTEMGVIRQGLEDVITGPEGTGASAFIGFPLDQYPVAGKTGTAQYSATSDLNRAWFVSYAPANDPQYVVAVYIDQAGHGGESAAPVARQIYEGIFGIDKAVEAGSGSDVSD
jgi:penicillin-binding protein 2